MLEREYSVTYKTKDGRRLVETVVGRNHSVVERKIAAMGGNVIDIDRVEDDYPSKSRSLRRTIGCSVVVILIVVFALIIYWYRFNPNYL